MDVLFSFKAVVFVLADYVSFTTSYCSSESLFCHSNFSWPSHPFEQAVVQHVSESPPLASCFIIWFGGLLVFKKLLSLVTDSISFLGTLRINHDKPVDLVVGPFLNFFVAFLYYRIVYDLTGTSKPSWTENLGYIIH